MRKRLLWLLVPTALLASIWELKAPEAATPTEKRPLPQVLAQLPERNLGRFGKPGDTINLLFAGSREKISPIIEGCGWTPIDRRTQVALVQGLADLLRGGPLKRFPPMNDYHLGGRVQDLNFAIPTNSIHSRHHFRLWRLPYLDDRGRELWWGSGNYDVRIRWWDLSHVPDPSMAMERDFIASTLRERGVALSLVELPQVPRSGENDKGYPFTHDGSILLAEF